MIEQTGVPTDFAIEGDGFFVVNTPQGERYTRTGAWSVSPAGELVTQEGYKVQGENGAINILNASFTVDSNGNVTSMAGTDKIRLVNFDDLSGLRKEGNNLYSSNTAQIIPGTPGTIKQGCLEGSNVDLSKQMVDMIEISRSFEINQRMIRMQDEKLGKSVSEIGRL
jgi:flagellar basal-body rod protein FlgG